MIATGGHRGDFAAIDTLNYSLLLTQGDEIVRLSPIDGGFTAPVPGPVAGAGLPGVVLAALERIPFEPLRLPHAGETFHVAQFQQAALKFGKR